MQSIMAKPDIEQNVGRGEESDTPRPPTPEEIAEAIINHATGDGSEPRSVDAAYQEMFVEGGGTSQVTYWGPIGAGQFEMPWPTTSPPEEAGE